MLALVPFQIGESIYPFYTYIVKNLAYDVILGADFLTYHNSTINFDSNTIELPPPTDTPPPCPTYAFWCSVHASLTCMLPPFSESILPAVLYDSLLTPVKSSRVGLVESNPMLAKRSLLAAAAHFASSTQPLSLSLSIAVPISDTLVCTYNPQSRYQPSIPTRQKHLRPLNEEQQTELQLADLLESYRDVFATTDYDLGHTCIACSAKS